MVVLAQQLLSVGCWRCRKHDEFELKCQFQHVSLGKKHQEKTGRLCDSHNTNWDLWFGISKKTPQQRKPFHSARCSHGFHTD